MATGCESRRWGTTQSQTRGRAGVTANSGLTVLAAWAPTRPSVRWLSFTAEVCPSMWKPICSVLFVWIRSVAWKTGRNYWRLSFFRASQTEHVDHRSSISIAGPGINLLYMYCEPRKLFLVLSAAAIHFSRVSFFCFFFLFSLLYSSVAQTLKNVGPLDCKLHCGLLRR